MKGVVLAAGRGSRLKPITSYIPKPLLPVNRRRVIDKVIHYLSRRCEEILVISGHLCDLLDTYINRRYPSVRLLKVDRINSGNLYTLLQAEALLKEEEFVIANADHLFPEEVWDFFPAGGAPVQLACHRKGTRAFFEDEMKVRVKDGKLLNMGKDLKDYEGAYTGLAYVGKGGVEVFWEFAERALTEYEDKAKVEDVFNLLAERNIPEIVWIDSIRFYEIDTIEDLRRAWNEARACSL